MKVIFYLFIFLFCCSPVSAVYVDSGTVFISENTTFYIATPFNCSNVSIYNSTFNVDGGNFTATNITNSLNISLENLNNTTKYLNFTSNVSINLLIISKGFAGFTVINENSYNIYTQTENVLYGSYNVTKELINFINIPSGSYFITLYTSDITEDLIFQPLINLINAIAHLFISLLNLLIAIFPLIIAMAFLTGLALLIGKIFDKLFNFRK